MIYTRNADGGVTNPPVIQRYEQDLQDAAQRCDYAAILRLTAQYNTERDALVRADEGTDSGGLGWSEDDMRGGVPADATALAIRPKFPETGRQYMPPGADEAMLAQNEQLRAEMRELRSMMGRLIERGETDTPVDKPTPAVEPSKPIGSTTVTAGPSDAPTPSVTAAPPTGGTGVTAGPVDPPNPAGPPLVPGGGVVPGTGATDDTHGSSES